MKIITETENKLILDLPQWAWRIRGIMTMLISFIIMIYMDFNYQINCQQKSVGIAQSCTLQTRLYGYHLLTTPLNSLQGAFVQRAGYDANSHSNLYRIQLKTSSGLVALSDGSSTGFENKERIVNAINDYVKDSTSLKFKIHESKSFRYFVQIIAGLVFLIGLLIFISVSHIKVTLDKLSETITINRKWLCFSKTTSYAWSEVIKFDIQEKIFTWRYNTSTMYRILIQLSNSKVELATRLYNKNIKDMKSIVDKLNAFLGYEQKNDLN